MNKPATKEPSMDEILSSIRQIIADDDASAAPPPIPKAMPVATAATPSPRPVVPPVQKAAPEPLALSPAQMIPAKPAPAPMPVPEPEPAPSVSMDFSAMLSDFDEPEGAESDPMAEMLAGEPELIDPEDVAFEAEPEPEAPVPILRTAEPPPRAPEPRPAPRPAASVAYAAPMPDPTLSSDMAEQLLAPATDAAVHGAMARLGALSNTGIGGMTVEGMIRDMLRPMLKDWLDENLPSLVERMVEKEIARVSRGVK